MGGWIEDSDRRESMPVLMNCEPQSFEVNLNHTIKKKLKVASYPEGVTFEWLSI